MYNRYHIHIEEVPPRGAPVGKFDINRADNCVNCGTCIRSCVYGVHKRDEKDGRSMAEPLSHLCKNCFRCIMECPQRALSMSPGKVYTSLGQGIWAPQRIFTIWNESLNGKVPVFGAGYRGRFSGPGYDGMWTDMSEIVRPTRDGIHGREYISTGMNLGRKLRYLEFDGNGKLQTAVPKVLELPLPMMLDTTRLTPMPDQVIKGLAHAAEHVGTLILVPVDRIDSLAGVGGDSVVPVLLKGAIHANLPAGTKMVEIRQSVGWESLLTRIKEERPEVHITLRMPAGKGVENEVLQAVKYGVDVVHLDFAEDGKEDGANGRYLRDALRAIHTALVKAGGQGPDQRRGRRRASPPPSMCRKSIICGADCIVLERALKVSLGLQGMLWTVHTYSCPLGHVPMRRRNGWRRGSTNMIGSWRDQLLEVMGAMGIREVRRLRGEQGRAIFYEDAERDAFAGIDAERSG